MAPKSGCWPPIYSREAGTSAGGREHRPPGKPDVGVPNLGGCGRAADQPAGPQRIFRYTDTDLSTIHLGEIWNAEGVPETTLADTVVGLPAGSFSGAQAIRVHRTPGGVVTAIMFDYPQSVDFQQMQAEYTDLLGAPVLHQRLKQAEAAQHLVWQSASAIYARLSVVP